MLLKTPCSTEFNLPLTIMMERISVDNHWSDNHWRLLGVVPARSNTSDGQIRRYKQGSIYRWSGFKVCLHKRHCAAYYENLRALEPKLFIICRKNDHGLVEPVHVTLDCDEAAAYMEADEPVFSCPIPLQIGAWLEAYIVEHYQSEPIRKRRRKEWSTEN